MNRKQKKELRQRQSTRQLMGIVRVTPHGIVTDSGERAFFLDCIRQALAEDTGTAEE